MISVRGLLRPVKTRAQKAIQAAKSPILSYQTDRVQLRTEKERALEELQSLSDVIDVPDRFEMMPSWQNDVRNDIGLYLTDKFLQNMKKQQRMWAFQPSEKTEKEFAQEKK